MLNAAVPDLSQTAQLSRLEEELRLRLAAKGAGAAAFDWDVAGGTIAWDGATDILPLHLDTASARGFLDAIAAERRAELQAVLDSRDTAPKFFVIDIEIASAMGIKQNYLYRVLPALEKDGKVVKRDRGWHAKG